MIQVRKRNGESRNEATSLYRRMAKSRGIDLILVPRKLLETQLLHDFGVKSRSPIRIQLGDLMEGSLNVM